MPSIWKEFSSKVFQRKTSAVMQPFSFNTAVRTGGEEEDMFKAYIPDFLYKPPYGFPRKQNLPRLKQLAKNSYVYSIIKTITDEAVSVPWSIKLKEEFNESDSKNEEYYEKKIKEITKFLRNPNGNEESFEYLMRQVITDILEIDSGVLVKVFNRKGEFKHLFARDGGTFLKNPDIYGYLGDRADFVLPLPEAFNGIQIDFGGTPTITQQQLMKQYNILYRERAGYYQYGWTAGSMPVPFGKREIIYMIQNPRGDSIYGRPPTEVLNDIILNLIYGAQFNLDFYVNNNMPEGVIQLLGAQREHIEQFRANWENQLRFEDSLGNKRKRFFQFPISSQEVKFTPFQLNPKDMDVLAQQEWFQKIMFMTFGVTANEMGFTESVNRATGEEQSEVHKRKAVQPLLQVIAYYLNTQLIPEFFVDKPGGELPDFADIPVELTFDLFDAREKRERLDILERELRMGIKTPLMVAKEMGINLDELKESLVEWKELNPTPTSDISFEETNPEQDLPTPNLDQKSLNPIQPEETEKTLFKEMDNYIDEVGKSLLKLVDNIPEENAR